MESEWPRVSIQSLIDDGVITAHKDGNYGAMYPRKSEFSDAGILFLTAKLVSDSGIIDFSSAPRLNYEKASSLPFGYIESEDVLLSHNATVGRVALVPELDEPVLVGTSLTYYRMDKERLLPGYLAAFFAGRDFQNQLQAMAGGLSTRNQVPITAQRKLDIVLPPIPIQRAIANCLGTLDDKIDCNRQMNDTLEAMAQALFKSWFVDFDPVIDNAIRVGNPIPDELADRAEIRRQVIAGGKANEKQARLFPATFQHHEELGWIPEGWVVTPLGDHLDVLETGRRPKGGVSKYKSGIPSVGAESIFGIGQFNFDKLKFVPEEFFTKMKSGKIQDHDVLLYKDGGKPGDFKPRSGMFGEGFPFKSFGINEHVFRMRSKELGQAFLYFQVSSERVFHHLAVRGGKAAIPGINQQEVRAIDFLVPGQAEREAFNEFCMPLISRILKSADQCGTLQGLRDTLLPKLISGELPIPDALEACRS